MTITFLDPTQEKTIATHWHSLQESTPLPPTQDHQTTATVIAIKGPHQHIPRHLYFYDPAGTIFLERAALLQQTYYQHQPRLVLFIDPATIPAFYLRHHNQTPFTALQQPGKASIIAIYERLMASLETLLGFPPTQHYPQYVAVVLTKVDQLPPYAHQQLTSSQQVRQWLCSYELGNLLADLEAHFLHVRYFASHSPAPEHKADAIGNVEPLQWLLGMGNK